MLNDMAFRVWTYFLAFIGIMIIILWMLQITFLEPYYKSSRRKNIQLNIQEVERLLQDPNDLDVINDQDVRTRLRLLFARENMCAILYDKEGVDLMSIAVDVIGPNCYLEDISSESKNEYIDIVKASETKEIDVPFRNEYFEHGMGFYGKEILVNDEPFYIFINTPMKLLDSTVDILKNQFLMVTVFIFGIGTTVALLLARKLAYPIHEMNESAKKLAKGDFNVKFKGEGYLEAVELSSTLNYATSEFSKTDELRRDLVANVSHDIKTPLTMIKAYAEMIVDISGEDRELRNEHLDVILDESNHLENLVNDMLSLSQFESKVLEINDSTFNLKEHIDTTINLFKGFSNEFVIDVPEKLNVVGDEIKMGQVLYNFVNNAIKHSNSNEKITINVKDLGREVRVNVIDKGSGISEENQAKIWDRYAKINKYHTRSINSSGLGLSIVAAICDATESDYGVESELNKGSTFYYTLKKAKQK
ncbi:MAG TPA: HAMP domain-containing sensor histidine kinase [Erysipelothrix sp.]|nr:HAMP domain-containing sensor histidine kinase [Erysipelothrix sp.]